MSLAVGGLITAFSRQLPFKEGAIVSTASRMELRRDEHAPWRMPWPRDQLENVVMCPVCSSRERAPLHEDLIDNVFFCAPGKWASWRCSQCGSYYLDPRPSPNSIHLAYADYYTHRDASPKASYIELSALRKLRRRLVNGYTNWRFSTRESPASAIGRLAVWAAWPRRIALDREFRHLPRVPEAGGSLLDLGCGDGAFLRLARSCGWDVVGLDPDPKAVANCVKQGLKVLEGGIERFHRDRDLFDVITMSHVVEHLHDPVGVLKACHRLLKPGGRLWIETPNVASLGHRHYGRNWRGLEPPRHLVLFNRSSLKTALSAAGFTRIDSVRRPNPVAWIASASDRIERGSTDDQPASLSLEQKIMIRCYGMLQAIFPACQEFLTVIAVKSRQRGDCACE